MTELNKVAEECAAEHQQLRNYHIADNIGITVKPLFSRLKDAWDFQTEVEQKHRALPSTIRMVPDTITDDATFQFFMLNLFKAGCMSHISVRPGLALPLSLMLVLKYSRGVKQTAHRKKALLVSLSHPLEIAESLMSHCLGRNVRPMLNGAIVEKDWPQLTRAAGNIYDLGIDFWKEGAFFESDYLKSLIVSSSCPYGLVLINNSTGDLELNDYGSVQRFKNIKSLATELKLPVIIINSYLLHYVFDAEIFDHLALFQDSQDRYQLTIKKADRKAYGKLSFVMSPICNIFEDASADT